MAGGLALLPGCAINDLRGRDHLDRAKAALRDKNLDSAIAEFRQAVNLDPTLADAHTGLGLAYKERGDLDQAADSLQQAVRLDPRSFTPVFELGEVYRLLNRMTQAIRAYIIACELDPRNFDSHFRLAMCYQSTGDLYKSIETYKEAIGINPRNAYAWSNLGAAYDTIGQHYEAIKAYKESLECNTRQPEVLVNLATVYLNQERWPTARKTLEAAIQLSGDLSIAHERLGYCYWRENNLDAAAQAYIRAISIDSKNAAAFAGYGVVRMTQYLNNPEQTSLRDEAVEAWHKSLELDPEQPKLRNLIEKYRPKHERQPIRFDDRDGL